MDKLETFEPGTEVIIAIGGYNTEYYETEIARQTKTQFETIDGRRFKKDTCKMIGSKEWHGVYAHPTNDYFLAKVQETIETKKRTKLIGMIRNAKLYNLQTDVLERIYELIEGD